MRAPPNVNALGVDLGGTNIRAAVVSADGRILERRHIATPYENGQLAPPEIWAEYIRACAAPLLSAHPEIRAVGVGCGGQFDPATGIMHGINTGDPRFAGYPMGAALSHALGLPVCIDNDVKMAALGEFYAGAGQGARDLLCVAVGTGIGGTLILNGELYHGRGGLAGHLGQFPDPQTGVLLESIAGGVPLGKNAIRDGILASGQTTDALFSLARSGNLAAAAHIQHAAAALGRVLAGLVHTLSPECILVGGSVGVQPEYIAGINAALLAALMPAWQPVRAMPMSLGTDAGQIGAGLCALRKFE